MPENTPHPPQHRPWENGWAPDTSRAPGTRRLWLAAALALVTVAACVTAIAAGGRTPPEKASPATTGAATDDGPGLLSFASPPARTTPPPKGESGMSSGTASATASPSPTPTAPARPRTANSPAPHRTSTKPSARWRSVRSVNYPDRYWHIAGGQVRLDPVASASDRRAATFKLVKGLSDARCYSFATADGGYLRHRDFLLRAEPDDGSRLFRQDATFCPRPSSFTGATTLESVNYPGRFLRHQNFQLKLAPYQDTGLYRADSAFRLVGALT